MHPLPLLNRRHLPIRCLGIVATCLLVSSLQAQQPQPPRWQAEIEVGGWAATGPAQPFWLRANQFGIVPLSAPAATLRAGLHKPYAPTDTTGGKPPRRLDWSAGVQVVGNAAQTSQFVLPEAYLKGRWRSVELSVGRWRQLTGLGDSSLSSGFINGSGNALPLPKVQLATPGYVPLGFTRRFVALNAGYVHGWFTGAYIEGSYLHQKYAYLRFGKPDRRLKVHVGLNHQVQWGGQADYLKNNPVAVNGKLPSQFKYYPYVALGLRPTEWENSDFTSFDGAYWIGNGLGSIDLGLELTTGQGRWLFYHQHIYDDVTGLLWLNVPDGLTGLSWQRRAGRGWLSRVVVEYLTTLDQSGSTFDYTARFQGNDNYFNHGQYAQGWSYLGRTIGTPFIMPRTDLRAEAQQGTDFFPNNRLTMAYVAATGQLGPSLTWQARLAYSRNFGTNATPYPAIYNQVSALATVQWPLPKLAGTLLTASLALDQGQLLPTSLGTFVSLRKHW